METERVRCYNNEGYEKHLLKGGWYNVTFVDNDTFVIQCENKATITCDSNIFAFLFRTKYISTSTNAIDPKHYKLTIEPKDFIIKNQLGFCEGNVIKYICRYKEKNGVEDLKKAKQYIDFLIDEYETKSDR